MCGIAGIVGPSVPWHPLALERMTRAQAHRGPDDAGVIWSTVGSLQVGVGHRRLAIQDLSAAGCQPMVHPDTGDVLVFNGEIYNAPALAGELRAEGVRFRGHSDTEVLLHALRHWGVECLNCLQGMYAFAWLDRRAGYLLLARDPLGIKPLYICRMGDQLLFASEVRALLASGQVTTDLDHDGLASLLAYGAVQAPWTLFAEIEVFPAGHWQRYLLLPEGALKAEAPQAHWQFPAPDAHWHIEDAVEAVQEQLAASVSSHLLSDVPVGVFLSSGIDSTLVAGLAARQQQDLRTFTVGFVEESDHSEADLAAETAKAFGSPHEVLWLEQAEALNAVLPWLDSLDQPSMDGLNTYRESVR